MATKAELESELAALKAEMKARDEESDTGETQASSSDSEADAIKAKLAEAGLDPADIEAVWDQLKNEFGAFQQKNPMLSLVAVFALGFVMGRVSK